MPEKDKDQTAPASEAEKARALAEASAEADAHPRDEMPKGGGFIVDGVKVDAFGVPLKDKD